MFKWNRNVDLAMKLIPARVNTRAAQSYTTQSSLTQYALTREHEGTERDTPSHGFVICHSH